MNDKFKKKRRYFTFHINIDDLLPATLEEKRQQILMRDSSTFLKDGLRRLKKNKVSMTCIFILLIIILSIIIIPIVWPYAYNEQLGIKQGQSVDGSYGNLHMFQYGATEQIQKKKYELGIDNLDLSNGGYEYRVNDKNIEYKTKNSDAWITFIPLLDLAETREYSSRNGDIEYNVDDNKKGYIQWRYVPIEIPWIDVIDISSLSTEFNEAYNTDKTINYKFIDDDLMWSVDNGTDDIEWNAIISFDELNETLQNMVLKNNSLEYQIINGKLQSRKIVVNTWNDLIKISMIKNAEAQNVFPHIFGTDESGRDYFIRVVYGTRVSLLVGLFASLIVLVIGTLYGSISSFAGGKVDLIMMRIVDVIYALPDMLIIILLSVVLKVTLDETLNNTVFATLGSNMISIFIVFGLLYWVGMARLIRGQILSLKEQEYILAARSIGSSPKRIIFKHLLPNCISVIIISTALQIPSAIFTESYLSFLGLGVSAPMPSLGSLAANALGGIYSYAYRLIIPAVVICLIVLSLNLLGDGLRDAFDPKLKN